MKECTKNSLHRAGWLLGIPALLFIAGFAGLVGFDVLRPIPSPREEAVPAAPIPRRQSGASQPQGTTQTLAKANDVRSSITVAMPDAKGSRLAARARQAFLAFGEAITSESLQTWNVLIPAEFFEKPEKQERARRLNADYARLLSELSGFLLSDAMRDFNRGERRLNELWSEYNALYEAFRNFTSNSSTLREEHQGKNYIMNLDDVWKRFSYLRDRIEHSVFFLYVYHEHWVQAADFVHMYIRSPDSWKTEILLLRQLGPQGRALIARRSAERNWKALKRSIMSIGPDFRLPYRESWD